jgi:hypothetical protein
MRGHPALKLKELLERYASLLHLMGSDRSLRAGVDHSGLQLHTKALSSRWQSQRRLPKDQKLPARCTMLGNRKLYWKFRLMQFRKW